jgi:hypothetical protein
MIAKKLKLILMFGDITYYQTDLKIMIANLFGNNLLKKIINNL